MKTTNHFKNTIKEYLDKRAADDSLFAQSYSKENKNIDDCITYILNTVKESGCNGFADEEIYSMAVHYYDEATIEIGKPIHGQVIVNHAIQLTEEEIAEAKQQAKQKVINDEQARLTAKKTVSKPVTETKSEQPSLF